MPDMIVARHGAILELRFDRPAKKNAITGAMYDAMSDALRGAEADAATRVVLITAEGPTFTAGNDLGDFLAMPAGLTQSPAGRFIGTIAAFGKPIVAAVNGPAIGIGSTLLLHCDLVYAAPEATFSVPFVNLGLTAEGGSSLLLPAMMGFARAAALLLLGETFDAERALAAGLLTAVVPGEGLRERAMASARSLAGKPPEALRATRALMLAGRDLLHARMEAEAVAFSRALGSPEAKEAFAAFLERRAPDFSARG